AVHLARGVRPHPLDLAAADDRRRRPWLAARLLLRRDHRGLPAAVPGAGERRAATLDRPDHGPPGRRDRTRPRALHPARALRQLRPLAEGAPLLRDLPALSPRNVQAPARLSQDGADAMNPRENGGALLEADKLTIQFGGLRAVDQVSFVVRP